MARLAGVPGAVIRSARRKLADLESAASPQADLFGGSAPALPAVEPSGPHPVVERLLALDPDALSPRDALDLVYQLRQLARE